MAYDLTQLAAYGAEYAQINARLKELRPLMQAEIVEAARAKTKQAEIIAASRYTRETVRSTCRAAGITPDE